MVKSSLEKAKFIESLSLFCAGFGLLWFSIVQAYVSFPRDLFWVFLAVLIVISLFVAWILNKELRTFYYGDH